MMIDNASPDHLYGEISKTFDLQNCPLFDSFQAMREPRFYPQGPTASNCVDLGIREP